MPYDHWRECAIRCIGRIVFAGAAAMFALSVHLHFDAFESFRDAAVLALLLSAGLAWKSVEATSKAPERTLIWREVDVRARPREGRAISAFAGLVQETYGRFAFATLAAAVAMRIVAQAHLPV